MLLIDVVTISSSVAATSSRKAKSEAVAGALRAAGDDLATVTAYLSGTLPQRRIGVSWRSLATLPDPASEPALTISEVDGQLAGIAAHGGQGSASRRLAGVTSLFQRATAAEQVFLRALITGEVRQGALDGVMLSAIALAFDVPEAAVRRAAMLAGYAAPVAVAAQEGGLPALEEVGLEVGRPVRPMLAGSAPDIEAGVAAATGETGSAVLVDCKLDGIRIQAHRLGDDVRLFTRTLEDITDRLPEVAEAVLALDCRTAVLDGEAIALRPDGHPQPFQVTGARTASTKSPDELRAETPVTPYFFDLLHLDGRDLIDEPVPARMDALAALVPPAQVVARTVADSPAAAQAFFDDAVAHGHEGVVLKSLAGPYAAGRRGAGWVKVKPRHTLDLVVLAVEWGSGRRRGWLSNIHMGARDAETGGFVMLGKTFKGMTDEMLAWQTERFLELEESRMGHVVHLRPEQVVEIAFDGLQSSRRYPGGLALRFARVLRYRDDKSAAEADTIETVRSLA